jgi:hexosaminidase
VILCCRYLDHLNIKWDAAYSNEPCPSSLTDKECALVLGGQGEMWGETVDASDLEATVWPRLGAIGERLWSPQNITDADAAKPRIEAFRCLLNRRGVRAAPPNNANARSAPPGAGGCYEQR